MNAFGLDVRSSWRPILLVGGVLAATIVKLILAYTTFGTTDVAYWEMFLEGYRRLGGLGLYRNTILFPGRFNEVFNHPPFMILVLRALGGLQEVTGLPFPFLLRIPPILADAGSVWLVAAILRRLHGGGDIPLSVVAMAVAPASIFISGFHGNTDPVMIFFVVLAVYFLTPGAGSPAAGPLWLSALAFGMSLNVKVVPLVLLPVFFFYLRGASRRIQFFTIAGAVVVAGSLPYIAQDPVALASRILGYGGQYGYWGISRFLTQLPEPWRLLAPGYARWGKYLLLGAITSLAYALNRRASPPPLFLQCGAVLFLFLLLTPGFGVQYLAWLVPWVAGLQLGLALLFYASSGLFLFLVYNFWSGGLPWYFGDSFIGIWGGRTRPVEIACWLSIGVVFAAYLFRFSGWRPASRRLARDTVVQTG